MGMRMKITSAPVAQNINGGDLSLHCYYWGSSLQCIAQYHTNTNTNTNEIHELDGGCYKCDTSTGCFRSSEQNDPYSLTSLLPKI